MLEVKAARVDKADLVEIKAAAVAEAALVAVRAPAAKEDLAATAKVAAMADLRSIRAGDSSSTLLITPSGSFPTTKRVRVAQTGMRSHAPETS